MQGYSILKNLFNFLLDTGLTNNVFHSVQLIEEDDVTYPAYPLKTGDFEYVGLNDKLIMTAYVRQIDELRVANKEKIASEIFEYECIIPHRVVFFNQNENRNPDDLLQTFVQLAFLPGISLSKVIVNKEKLMQLESKPKAFKLDSKSFYCAIDFELLLRLKKASCRTEILCADIPNPYCKQ